MLSKIYIWCKNEDKQNVFCFSKGISNEDIINYIKDYGYSIYKEITKSSIRTSK